MHCIIAPGMVSGDVYIPPSKSESMRAIIFGAMAEGVSYIDNILQSPDVYAMIDGVRAFGAQVEVDGSSIEITGVGGKPQTPTEIINVGNSGLALRFLLSLAALVEGEVLITGDESIRTRRPVKPLLDVYAQCGMKVASFSERKDGCISVIGKIRPGSMLIQGEDSQPVSSLLFTTSFLEDASEIYVLKAGERPFLDLTVHWLEFVGAGVYNESYRVFEVEGGLSYPGFSMRIGGDYSTSLFPLAAALITGGQMNIHGLNQESMQGDRKALDIFRKMGASIEFDYEGVLTGERLGDLKGIDVDINHCIDVLPILSVLASYATSKTVIRGAEIARLKECNRIGVMTKQLTEMGASVEDRKDGMVIYPSKLYGAHLSGEKDHRVVMALMAAAAGATGKSMISGPEALVKTYPTAIYDFLACGMNVELTIK